mmetsp:Transcript_8840/g.19716  ORF Transcript_8840/g.19716 Transcript_8840/m.19716 type:complete len:120 (+) Transcript_8840:723-1082(+)
MCVAPSSTTAATATTVATSVAMVAASATLGVAVSTLCTGATPHQVNANAIVQFYSVRDRPEHPTRAFRCIKPLRCRYRFGYCDIQLVIQPFDLPPELCPRVWMDQREIISNHPTRRDGQ